MDDRLFSIYAFVSIVAGGATVWMFDEKIRAIYDKFGSVMLWISILIFILGGAIMFLSPMITGHRFFSATIGLYLFFVGASTRKVFSSQAARNRRALREAMESD